MNTRKIIILVSILIAVLTTALYYITPKGTIIEITVDKSKITVGDNIEVTLTITNKNRETKTYDISPPPFDILVYHENSTLWAKYTDGKAFPEIYIRKNLTQGESYQEKYLWDLYKYDISTFDFITPQPGIYQLEGVFRSEPDLKTEKIRIEIASKT